MNEINWFFSNIKLIFSLREASSALPLLQMALKKKIKLNNKKEFIAFNNIFSHVLRVGSLFPFFPLKNAILKIAGKVITH